MQLLRALRSLLDRTSRLKENHGMRRPPQTTNQPTTILNKPRLRQVYISVHSVTCVSVTRSILREFSEMFHLSITAYKAYSRHLKQHIRPFKCLVIGCFEAFALKTGLEDHVNAVHTQAPHQMRWYCRAPECKVKLAVDGTAHRDSWKRHMSNKHGWTDKDMTAYM